jgi:hypothetical protein
MTRPRQTECGFSLCRLRSVFHEPWPAGARPADSDHRRLMNGPFIANFAMNGPFINIGPHRGIQVACDEGDFRCVGRAEGPLQYAGSPGCASWCERVRWCTACCGICARGATRPGCRGCRCGLQMRLRRCVEKRRAYLGRLCVVVARRRFPTPRLLPAGFVGAHRYPRIRGQLTPARQSLSLHDNAIHVDPQWTLRGCRARRST